MLGFEYPTRRREKAPLKHSTARHGAILAKLEAPYSLTVSDWLSTEEGISAATIYNWRKHARGSGSLWETAALTEEELAQYCRRRSLYPVQSRRWRASCNQANDRSHQGAT